MAQSDPVWLSGNFTLKWHGNRTTLKLFEFDVVWSPKTFFLYRMKPSKTRPWNHLYRMKPSKTQSWHYCLYIERLRKTVAGVMSEDGKPIGSFTAPADGPPSGMGSSWYHFLSGKPEDPVEKRIKPLLGDPEIPTQVVEIRRTLPPYLVKRDMEAMHSRTAELWQETLENTIDK